jgi:heavy metal translocating P-type ATPase
VSEACTHCGLGLGRRAIDATVAGVAGRYCCVGCVLAHQVTGAHGDDARATGVLVRLGLAVFFAMNVMMVSLPTYVGAVYGGPGVRIDGPLFALLRWLAMGLAAPVLALLGGPIVGAAWQAARRGIVTADGLVVLGTVAAYALSVVNTLAGRPAVYYDTATMLLVLVTLGRYLEARARADAGRLVRATLAGPPLPVRCEADGEVREISPDALRPGDVVRIVPGEAMPADGVVVAGVGGVDESALSGESRPVAKRPGDGVAGGTCSVDGTFRIRVTAAVAESTVARIAAMTTAALRERTRLEGLADRVAAVLVPIVLAIAAAAGVWWARQDGVDRGVMVALAILVVACPCGLGLATPLAIWTGVTTAARRGLVVRRADVLERLAHVRRVLFDKTGTLTTAVPRIVRVASEEPDRVLALAAALEAGLRHPVARGVVAEAARRGIPVGTADAVEVVPGRGVRGVVAGHAVAVGSPEWIVGTAEAVASEGTPIAIGVDGRLAAVLWLEEALVPGAAEAVGAVRGLGLDVGLVSGDTHATAVARLFALAERRTRLGPDGKVAAVREARDQGFVAMVGDGVNDAPALAAADVGVAVGDASDLTRLTADVLVVAGGVAALPWLVAHARRVVAIARENLAWAFGYNAIAVALAASGRLDPVVAALAMIASSVAVVANARRLRAPRAGAETPAPATSPAAAVARAA